MTGGELAADRQRRPTPMALLINGITRCALCGAVLDVRERLVATSHFLSDPAHPLYRYSDAALHRGCFLRWEHRAAFVDAYNANRGRMPEMRRDGSLKGDRRRRWIRRWDALLDRLDDFRDRWRRG